MDRQTNNGQGDNRPDHRGTIRDIQIPVYEKNSHDLNSYLNRFERICTALRRSVGIGTGKVPKESCVRSLWAHECRRCAGLWEAERWASQLFSLTEEGYRKKLKGAVREKDETGTQFGGASQTILKKVVTNIGLWGGLRRIRFSHSTRPVLRQLWQWEEMLYKANRKIGPWRHALSSPLFHRIQRIYGTIVDARSLERQNPV